MARTKRGKGATRSTATYFNRGSIPFLSIYCDGSASYVHEKWRIATLIPRVQEQQILWVESISEYHDPGTERVYGISGLVTQHLVQNEWVDQHNPDPSIFYEDGFRSRWHFKCGRCSLERNIADPRSLYGMIGQAVAAGINEIELSHLLHTRR